MPYFFVGKSWQRGYSLKLQYYPGHFMNDEYYDLKTGTHPYEDLHVHLFLISIGYDVHKIHKGDFQKKLNQRKVVASIF
jgi:hypothetical protein